MNCVSCRVRVTALVLIGFLGTWGCDPQTNVQGDGGVADGSADGRDAGPSCQPSLDPNQPWTTHYLKEIIAPLTGYEEIIDGIIISDRAHSYTRAFARTFIQNKFLELGLQPELHDYGGGVNVYGILAATFPTDEHVLLCAHYDSVIDCPGADDNASGVGMVFQIARYTSMLSCRGVNYLFVLVDEEEQGLIGSQHFAQKIVDENIAISSVHCFDMNGWDGDGDRAIEISLDSDILFNDYEQAYNQGNFHMKVSVYPPTAVFQSDYLAFRQIGLDSLTINEEFWGMDSTPYYHSPQDTFETLDFDYMHSTCVLVNLVMRNLAEVP